MGNDFSRLKGLEIDKNSCIEANDFWILFNATESTINKNEKGEVRQLLSVFQGEPVVNGQLWSIHGMPMERAIKNLKIYRHPYILKYVTTWDQGACKHLATERVRPLASVINIQSDIQVCLGLRTILCSLIFLIEKALARHLNITTSSIYITENGSWRLGGFEFVWKNKDVNQTLLDLANPFRYKDAIDPGEIKEEYSTETLEQYAFASLCEEILSKCPTHDVVIPHVQEFRDYCATHLRHKNAQMRPKLSAVLLHPYFNHEFVLIHSFLFELPLKSVQERQDFFTGLINRLRYFNEDVVGAHLATDLLSRMVLLDPTAQLCITPYVLKTKNDQPGALFTSQAYTRHLLPIIRKMFRLRDAQIRLILLEYFMEYVRLMSEEELKDFILPYLVEGMNDTNDVLVAKTLRCMADLVPILSAAVVLGGARTRIFSDGRPQAAVSDVTVSWVEPRSITPVMGNRGMEFIGTGSPLRGSFSSLDETKDHIHNLIDEDSGMPTRLSPDGGEDNKDIDNNIVNDLSSAKIITDEVIDTIINNISNENNSVENSEYKKDLEQGLIVEEEEAWSDWETDELHRLNGHLPTTANILTPIYQPTPGDYSESIQNSIKNYLISSSSPSATQTSLSEASSYHTSQSNVSSSAPSLKPTSSVYALKINDDLFDLDIKVKKMKSPTGIKVDEFDFFKDMEPVIETKKIKDVSIPTANENIIIDTSRFAAATATDLTYCNGDDINDIGHGWDDVDVVDNID